MCYHNQRFIKHIINIIAERKIDQPVPTSNDDEDYLIDNFTTDDYSSNVDYSDKKYVSIV